jgi:putative ABC transport system permease protein
MRTLFRRLAFWVNRRQLEAELAEEIESHRAMTEARLQASGFSAADARARSRRALGNVTLAREEARSVWIWPWLDGVRQDTAYAVRALRKNPGFTAAVMLVTSLGVGATTSVFTLIDALVLRSLPVRAPEQLVYFRSPGFSYPIYTEVRARTTNLFSDFFAWSLESAHVDWTGELEPSEVLTATGDFYQALGVAPILGRGFRAEDDRVGGGPHGPVAVLSYASWMRRFNGDPSAIGRTIRIDRVPFTIVGVAPRGFFGVVAGLAPEVTIPLTVLQSADGLASHSSAWLHLMGRLREGVTISEADAVLQPAWRDVLAITTPASMPSDRRAKYLGRQTALESGRAGFSRVRRQFEEPLWILLGLVGLLFAVACASTANLLIARGVARKRELAVRLAIGASRGRLIRQFLTESFVWCALGAMAGVLLASWMSGILVAMMTTREEPIVLDVSPNGRIMLFALGLTSLTVVVCSAFPALAATRLHPATTLAGSRQGPRGMLGRWSGGRLLVTGQVALTLLLLVGAALFTRSLAASLSQDAGFDRNNILVVSTDALVTGLEGARLDAFHGDLQARLEAIPGILSTSLSMYPPISDQDGSWTQSIVVDGEPQEPESSRFVYFNAISPGYFSTLGMHPLRGRDFTTADTLGSAKVAIVNESLARTFFRDRDPIGRRISIGRDRRRQDLEIVGVARDAKYQTLQESPRSIAYLPVLQHASGTSNLVAEVRTAGSSSSLVDTVRREVRALSPAVPIRIETVSDRIRASLVKERVMALLASALGLVALVIACAGVYGLLAYAVSRQTREIGVRLALGANRATVVRMVLGDCLVVAAAGTAVGIAVSLALARYARTLLFQVNPADPASFVAAGAIMVIVSLCAGLVPARRAAAVDPVTALKAE